MVKLRTNIVAKLNHSGDNGMIAAHRSDILRLIYERKDRFGVRVRQCDINDILTALNLKQSEVQTVENMIRGHRRMGFRHPPKPINAKHLSPKLVETTIKNTISPKEQKTPNRTPSPIIEHKDRIVDNGITQMFDECGIYDPSKALLPAKKRLKFTFVKDLMLTSSLLSNASPHRRSPSVSPPINQYSISSSTSDDEDFLGKPPLSSSISHIRSILDENEFETTEQHQSSEISPKRDLLTNLDHNQNELSEIIQRMPILEPAVQVSVPAELESILSMFMNDNR